MMSSSVFACRRWSGKNGFMSSEEMGDVFILCLCVCGRTLRADGVCESVLYGLPLVLRPTTCWQLDWDEMESNHNLFHALCGTLQVSTPLILHPLQIQRNESV